MKVAYVTAAQAVKAGPGVIPAGCAIAVKMGDYLAVVGPVLPREVGQVLLCGELRGPAGQPLASRFEQGGHATDLVRVATCDRAGLAKLLDLLAAMTTAGPRPLTVEEVRR